MSVSRNDPCPCGSGRKYKKCCLGAEPVEKVKARRNLGIAWGVVLVLALVVAVLKGTPAGIAAGLAGAALVGAWIMMHDHSEAGADGGAGAIMGAGSSGAGANRRTRATTPPGTR